MTNPWLLTAAAAAASWALAGTVATAQTPGDGGQTVPDGRGGVWLADMDLPASMPLTVPLCASTASPNCINPNGSMNYQTAQQWIAALNAYKGVGYLGRRDWQLPTTQPLTAGCMSTGPHGESFGYGCAGSALGSLYRSMGLIAPGSAAGPVTGDFEGFDNLQPNLYWTDTIGAAGIFTFSFATGWRGANQGRDTAGKNPVANFFYVLPMLDGDPGVPGVIYDSDSNKSFLADGNIAASNTFGLPTCDGLGDATSAPCVNADGRMTQTSAEAFVQAMKATSYLGQSGWKLPPSTQLDNCHYAVCASPCPRTTRWRLCSTTALGSAAAAPWRRTTLTTSARSPTCNPTSTGPARPPAVRVRRCVRRVRRYPNVRHSARLPAPPTWSGVSISATAFRERTRRPTTCSSRRSHPTARPRPPGGPDPAHPCEKSPIP